MRREWILTTKEVRQCLLHSASYSLLSRNTIYVSGMIVLAFILCWLTLSGMVNTSCFCAAPSLMVFFFLSVVVAVGWSLNMLEMHRPVAALIITLFIADLVFLNLVGEGIPAVIKAAMSGTAQHTDVAARLFISLGDFIAFNILLSLWPGFYWIAMAWLLLAQFRNQRVIAKAIIYRLLINLPVLGMQIFVFASMSIILLLMTSFTRLPVLLLPLLAVWNCVFIFLVIVRIENGMTPDVTIGQIARVKLTLRK